VSHDLEHVLDAHGRNGNDGNTVLDGEPCEADPLLPDELVLLVLVLHHLAPAARENEDRLIRLEQTGADLARSPHGTHSSKQISPDRESEVVVVAQAPHRPAGLLVDLEVEHRDVEQAVDRVVPRQQHGPLTGHVFDPERDGAEPPLQGLDEMVELRDEGGIEVQALGVGGGHEAPTHA
jgi:hypothetical protein